MFLENLFSLLKREFVDNVIFFFLVFTDRCVICMYMNNSRYLFVFMIVNVPLLNMERQEYRY